MKDIPAHPQWNRFEDHVGNIAMDSMRLPTMHYVSIEKVNGVWYCYSTKVTYWYAVISELTAMALLQGSPMEAETWAIKRQAEEGR